jgi:hypothetical protein
MRAYHLVALTSLLAAVVAYMFAWHSGATALFVLGLLLEGFAWGYFLVNRRRAISS